MIFDGKKFAGAIEQTLKDKVDKLAKKPKLVAILDPKNMGSVIYTNLKEKFAQRIGVGFEKYEILDPRSKILELNSDESVNGILLQLPFPNSQDLINLIDLKKDVDGLRDDSPFKSAAVRATLQILNTPPARGEVLIVGSQGFVGRKLMHYLPNATGMDKEDFDLAKLKLADVIVSATGQGNLIKPEMVKDGVIAIDLGYPMGDFVPEVAAKSSFFTPVPGGVGPVTVAMLFQNLLDSINGGAIGAGTAKI